MPRMTVLLTAIMGPIGLFTGCFLELAPGFTALTAFSAMSTTALILITVTLDRCRNAGRSASTTSRETRRGMGEATWAMLAMKRRLNTRSPDIGVLRMAGDTTRARSGLNQRRDKARAVLSRFDFLARFGLVPDEGRYQQVHRSSALRLTRLANIDARAKPVIAPKNAAVSMTLGEEGPVPISKRAKRKEM